MQEVLCSLHPVPPVTTSCTSAAQYGNQEVGISTKSSPVLPVFVCVYVCVEGCNFIACGSVQAAPPARKNCSVTKGSLPHRPQAKPLASLTWSPSLQCDSTTSLSMQTDLFLRLAVFNQHNFPENHLSAAHYRYFVPF